MPHFASPADELRHLEEKQASVGLSDEEQARLAALSPPAFDPAPGGFDVATAAAGVHAEVELPGEAGPGESPSAPVAWTAADYGWDPTDPNAVAWAAYYSELGWDPATVYAHLAGEAEAAANASRQAGAVEPLPEAEARESETVVPPPEVEPAGLLPEVAFTGPSAEAVPARPEPALDGPGASWDAPAAVPSYAPEGDEVPQSEAPSGRTSLWDLGAVEAAVAAAAATPAAEPEPAPDFQHAVPPGWPGEPGLAVEGDFALAGDGSFDPTSSPALPGAEAEPLAAAAPPPLGELADQEFAIDLEGDDLAPAAERAPAGAPSEPAPPAEPFPALDLSAPFLSEPEPEPEPAPHEGPAPELDWAAAHALPEGDHAVDFAAFDAEPHGDAPAEEEQPAPPEGTALWSLPLPPPPAAPDLEVDEPLVPPLGLGPLDGAPAAGTRPPPAPTPERPPPEPADASLDVPFHLGAEPEAAVPLAPGPGPSEPATPGEAVDAPPLVGDAEFLAFAASADALATAEPRSQAEVEVEVAELTDADILEVGDDVVELVGDGPDLAGQPAAELEAAPEAVPHAEAAPFAATIAAAGPALETEAAQLALDAPRPRAAPPGPDLLAPEPPGAELQAPPEPSLAAPEPEPLPSPDAGPSAYVAGTHRVVVHTADGQVKRGTVSDLVLDAGEVLLAPQSGGAPEPLAADRIRAIFFMLPTGEAPPPPAGKKVRVTFRDGRQVAGFSPDYDPGRVGFFMIPADTRTHTARIWVYRSSVRQVSVS